MQLLDSIGYLEFYNKHLCIALQVIYVLLSANIISILAKLDSLLAFIFISFVWKTYIISEVVGVCDHGGSNVGDETQWVDTNCNWEHLDLYRDCYFHCVIASKMW